ncbi:MAG: glucose-6-phosphate dehydrogenase [Alicyclobacillus sp.]|nr:glucose-6-phosphate dehydrogenase [Alicyclobacillus sp.]
MHQFELHKEQRQPAPQVFILFGATGDLAQRKLYPALYSLYQDNLLPDPFAIIGVARSRMDDGQFRSFVRESVGKHGRKPSEAPGDTGGWPDFAERFFYRSVDVNRSEDFQELRQLLDQVGAQAGALANRVFYLAMAPEFFGKVALQLKEHGLLDTRGFKRLIIEKPFGHDLASAHELNGELYQVFDESEIFRIDHYLGKEMVQNIEVIRFANSIFEPVWNNRSIANVQITSSETVGVEDRAGYYETAGALRDMVQNHMLQMVMMVAMEPPSRLRTEAIRDEKVKVLRSLRRYSADEAARHVVRGQYGPGRVLGEPVPGYREEKGVKPDSHTETFVAARLFIDNFRWAGVPFYIRTGKRMALKSTEIVIQFRNMPEHLYFNEDGRLGPNLLVIRINPVEGMYLQLNAKRPGTEGGVVPVAMEFSQPRDSSPEAYERLLYDAMRGDSTYFTRWDEVSLAWKLVDPMAEAFADNRVPLHAYPAGSWGPEAARALPSQDGFSWWPVYGEETPSVEHLLIRRYAQPVDVREAAPDRQAAGLSGAADVH